MKTLGVLLLVVVCVSAGSWSKSKEEKKKNPTIKGVWLSENKKRSYIYLNDETWIEYFTSDKKEFKRYKTVGESEHGYKIIKPFDKHENFYLAVSESQILYRKSTYKFIESKGHVESKGSWIYLDKKPCATMTHKCHDPCKDKKCPRFKHAHCVPDTCHGCDGFKFVDKEVVVKCKKDDSYSDSHSKSHSRSHSKSHSRSHSKSHSRSHSKSHSRSHSKSNESSKCKHCPNDPCHKKNKCHAFPLAKCVRDCKTCKAKWYLHKKKVSCNKDHSDSHHSSSESKSCEYPVKCFHDPCKNKKCKGHSKAKCTMDNCGSCKAKWTVGKKSCQMPGRRSKKSAKK